MKTNLTATMGLAAAMAITLMLMNETTLGKKMKVSRSFSVSGRFTGSIKDRITLRGKKIHIARSASIYVVGEGLKKPGVFVADRTVFVSGKIKNGVPTATAIIVRPAPAGISTAPSASAGRGRTGTNPNVGELTGEVKE